MSDFVISRSGCLFGCNNYGPLTAAVIVRWLQLLVHHLLQLCPGGSAASLREHFEIANSSFQPEWR